MAKRIISDEEGTRRFEAIRQRVKAIGERTLRLPRNDRVRCGNSFIRFTGNAVANRLPPEAS